MIHKCNTEKFFKIKIKINSTKIIMYHEEARFILVIQGQFNIKMNQFELTNFTHTHTYSSQQMQKKITKTNIQGHPDGSVV